MEISSAKVNNVATYPQDGLILLQRQIEDFNRAIQCGQEPTASGLDGLRAVQIIEATVKSAATGNTIKIESLKI